MNIIRGQGTVTRTFLERVRTTPQQAGYMSKVGGSWKKTTFQQYFEECRTVSLGLMRLGIQPSDKVSLFSNTRYEWPLCDMAILGAGAITVPIYPSSTPQDAAYILHHSDACAVIVENATQLEKVLLSKRQNPTSLEQLKKIIVIEPGAMVLAAKFPDLLPEVLTLDALKELGRRDEAKNAFRFEKNLESARPEDPLSICYTSGTTGLPKGVILTHSNMMSVLEDCIEKLGKHVKGRDTTVLSFLPFSHILGKVESFATYSFGWTQAFVESLDRLIPNIQEVRPTVIFAVPRIFEKAYNRIQELLEQEFFGKRKLFQWGFTAGQRFYESMRERRFPNVKDAIEYSAARAIVFRKVRQHFGGRLRFTICGGAPLAPEIGEFFQIAGLKILEGYGLTETCGPIAVNTPEDMRFGTVGRPLPDVSIKIARDGEIIIKSKKVFAGYYKMPAESSEVLKGGWFYTGDVGVIDDDGFLHITDRKKDLIITSGGKNVAPQKIENLARRNPLISQFVVYGDNRPYLTALVTLDQQKAIEYANEHLILFSAYPELIRHPKIIALVERIVSELNEQLASFEKIKKFLIVADDFSVEAGELTPSLKVKRRVITHQYEKELEHLYL